MHDRSQVSCRRACALAHICPNTWYFKSHARDASALRMRIRDIAQARPRFGYTRVWILLRREGWRDNKKRMHRLYRLEGLQVRMRARRKKRLSLHRGVVAPASGRDQAWSRDFVHDQLVTGRASQGARCPGLSETGPATPERETTGQAVTQIVRSLGGRPGGERRNWGMLAPTRG